MTRSVAAPGRPEEGCVEVAIGEEEPFLQTCSLGEVLAGGADDSGGGFVTKCCGRAEVIDPNSEACIRAESALSQSGEGGRFVPLTQL